mmetsp:Transcript_118776/g.378823  ORF Transcript_118776/g.378823 Transcript_118776/m.378823 type:complete len:260 (-) Transcript_118776:45-824(-)
MCMRRIRTLKRQRRRRARMRSRCSTRVVFGSPRTRSRFPTMLCRCRGTHDAPALRAAASSERSCMPRRSCHSACLSTRSRRQPHPGSVRWLPYACAAVGEASNGRRRTRRLFRREQRTWGAANCCACWSAPLPSVSSSRRLPCSAPPASALWWRWTAAATCPASAHTSPRRSAWRRGLRRWSSWMQPAWPRSPGRTFGAPRTCFVHALASRWLLPRRSCSNGESQSKPRVVGMYRVMALPIRKPTSQAQSSCHWMRRVR